MEKLNEKEIRRRIEELYSLLKLKFEKEINGTVLKYLFYLTEPYLIIELHRASGEIMKNSMILVPREFLPKVIEWLIDLEAIELPVKPQRESKNNGHNQKKAGEKISQSEEELMKRIKKILKEEPHTVNQLHNKLRIFKKYKIRQALNKMELAGIVERSVGRRGEHIFRLAIEKRFRLVEKIIPVKKDLEIHEYKEGDRIILKVYSLRTTAYLEDMTVEFESIDEIYDLYETLRENAKSSEMAYHHTIAILKNHWSKYSNSAHFEARVGLLINYIAENVNFPVKFEAENKHDFTTWKIVFDDIDMKRSLQEEMKVMNGVIR
jgi:hypothetical protein